MSTSIFSNSGTEVKVLKDQLSLNDAAKIRTGSDDPRSVAKEGAQGSLYLQTGSSGGKVFRKLDSGTSTNWTEVGSGAGGINYIVNPDAEAGTTGWSTYADAAGATPVNGTGGTATVTLTASTSSPLRGLQSFVLTKDAANRQGEGVSVDFVVDAADKSEVLVIEFDYLSAGTFVAGESSDVRVFIYDKDAAQLIIPIDHRLESLGLGKYKAYFQSSATSTNYRLIFHVATTSASAYTLKFDNVRVGPKAYFTFGMPTGDWKDSSSDVTISAAAYGTATQIEYWTRRVGDTLFARGKFKAGTVSTGDATLPLPSGLSVDSSKFTSNATAGSENIHLIGNADFPDSALVALGSGDSIGRVSYDDTTDLIYVTNQVETYEYKNRAANALLNNGQIVTFEFSVPILGWGSQLQTSEDVDLRNVVATGDATAVSVGASYANVGFSTEGIDTHAAFDLTTFVVPIGGIYDIDADVVMTPSASTGGTGDIQITQNNVAIGSVGSNGIPAAGQNYTFGARANGTRLSVGDEIRVQLKQNTGSSVSAEVYFTIRRLAGPAVVAPAETVAVKATRTTAQSIATSTETVVVFTGEDFDTHGAFDTSTGEFTAPVAGTYYVSATVGFEPTGAGPVPQYCFFEKNGSASAMIIGDANNNEFSIKSLMTPSGLVKLASGDTVRLKIAQLSGASQDTATTFMGGMSLSIHRVGL